MALIVEDFREYLQFYLTDYLALETFEGKSSEWSKIIKDMERMVDRDARIRYLQCFLWTMSDEMLRHYRADQKLQKILRQAIKVCSIIDGEFLRFNDYETKLFVSELQQLAGIEFFMVRRDPAEPFYEDLIHFIGNFIDWHKKKRGIPLTLW
jgi:hypothetical protein